MGSADEAFIEITDDLNYPMLIVTAGAGGERAVCLAVHLVPARAPQLAELFGSHTGDETDKFDRCRWHAGPRDLPILDECARWFAGAILERRLLRRGEFASTDELAARVIACIKDYNRRAAPFRWTYDSRPLRVA